jgi:hypothetical protein
VNAPINKFDAAGLGDEPNNLAAIGSMTGYRSMRGLTKPWPGASYACFGGGDLGRIYTERAELYDFVRDAGVNGFVTVSGDRHSFWAGYAAKALPPQAFEPVGVALG